MIGMLRRGIVIDAHRSTPGLSTVGAAAEHDIAIITGIIGDRTQHVDVATCGVCGPIHSYPRLAEQTFRVNPACGLRPTQSHQCAEIYLWCDHVVLRVG